MPLIEKIEEDFKNALKAGDRTRVSVLRLLKSALKNKEIELMKPLSDEDCLAVISSQIKQRRDSIEQ
ncbi:MAG: GatB/YqeY domain-containing protein, partial [Thermodesulfovibrionales bacterium]|nr:GatB/YqeY domain-containing protein [Thermodesulfovibrionales bacterium]